MQLSRIIRLLLSLLVVVFLLLNTTHTPHYPFLQQLENWTYDARLNFTLPKTIDKDIVIVDIDEASLSKVGHFPWKRNIMARLVNNLFDTYQIKTLGFDMVFAEKDNSSGLKTLESLAQGPLKADTAYLETLKKIRPTLEFDRLFADSLKNRSIALGYIFRYKVKPGEQKEIGLLPQPIERLDGELAARLPLFKASGVTANLPLLQQASASGGFFSNPAVDADGVFRKVALIEAYNDRLYPSLALATAQLAIDNPKIKLEIPTNGEKSGQNYFVLEAISLGQHRIPVDKSGAVYIPFRGPQGSFPYVSAYKILDKSADAALLKNKIVLIGATAPGLKDLRSTPVQSIYPGVEAHANLVSGILNQTIMQKPAYIQGYEFTILIIIGITMFLVLTYLPPILAAISSLLIALLVTAGVMLAWHYQWILPLASSLLLIALLFTLHMTYGFFVESRGKRQLAHMFGQYIPPELVDEMSETRHEFSLEGESREMTVLFSDVRGFTSISEGLDPKQLTRLMNALLTPMTRVIHKNRGTIDKYMGDAIMAFWGAPLHDPEHARHALYAAFDMMQALKVMQQEFAERGWPSVNIGIGLNTGIMSVGNMGSEFRVAYTALSDAVNLGSRLEGLTKAYKVNIIVSESTKAAVDEFVFKELDRVRVKGKNEPVTIYEPIGHKNDIDKAVTAELSRYKLALKYYHQQSWDKAEMEFFNLSRSYPDCGLYEIYLDRISQFKKHPPEADWDGVFTHTSK